MAASTPIGRHSARVISIVRAEPTSAPRTPASSGSRLSPCSKNAKFGTLLTRPLPFSSSSTATLWSRIFRLPSGLATYDLAPLAWRRPGGRVQRDQHFAFNAIAADGRRFDHAAIDCDKHGRHCGGENFGPPCRRMPLHQSGGFVAQILDLPSRRVLLVCIALVCDSSAAIRPLSLALRASSM